MPTGTRTLTCASFGSTVDLCNILITLGTHTCDPALSTITFAPSTGVVVERHTGSGTLNFAAGWVIPVLRTTDSVTVAVHTDVGFAFLDGTATAVTPAGADEIFDSPIGFADSQQALDTAAGMQLTDPGWSGLTQEPTAGFPDQYGFTGGDYFYNGNTLNPSPPADYFAYSAGRLFAPTPTVTSPSGIWGIRSVEFWVSPVTTPTNHHQADLWFWFQQPMRFSHGLHTTPGAWTLTSVLGAVNSTKEPSMIGIDLFTNRSNSIGRYKFSPWLSYLAPHGPGSPMSLCFAKQRSVNPTLSMRLRHPTLGTNWRLRWVRYPATLTTYTFSDKWETVGGWGLGVLFEDATAGWLS